MTTRSRLSPGAARAIDRLAARAHAFHRFAHHPLCDRYRGELLELGRRTRVCRGCVAMALGGPLGCLLAATHPPGSALATLVAIGAAFGAASLVTRLPKTLGRFVPALAGGAGLTGALLAGARSAAVALVLLAAVLLLAYRRRRPDRSPCESCPERSGPAPCSGFRTIVRRERAFQRVARRLVDRDLAQRGAPQTAVAAPAARVAS